MITLYRNLHEVFPFNVYLFCEGHGVLTAVLILRIVICLEVFHLVFWVVVEIVYKYEMLTVSNMYVFDRLPNRT